MIRMGDLKKAAVTAAIFVLASTASAARLGHPAYSASASTAAQRQWNILADPSYATDGSTTTLYSPAVASLNTVQTASPFYLVKILVSDLSPPTHIIEQDFSGPVTSYTFNFTPAQLTEQVGAVQVFWSLTPATTPGVMPAQPAYDPNNPGSADEDTHTLIFDNITGAAATANFENYQNPGSASGLFPNYFPLADFYQGYSADSTAQTPDPFTFGGPNNPTQIDPAETGPVISLVPEPGALMGIGLLTPLLLMRRVRRPSPSLARA
jgi:hypothetical protein